MHEDLKQRINCRLTNYISLPEVSYLDHSDLNFATDPALITANEDDDNDRPPQCNEEINDHIHSQIRE